MKENIWQKLQKPIMILAPMEDVTDTVFRQIVASCGRPDLFFTEFTNVEGLTSAGEKKVGQRLKFDSNEKPLIAQIWGTTVESFFTSAQKIAQMGFDGIDINMGCPERSVIKAGACSALIKTPNLAAQIIQAVKDGAPNMPISVKTRIGFGKIVTEEWIGFLLQQNLDAITVHGRTTKEMSLVPAHWDEIKKAVNLKNKLAPNTIIIGNGDVKSLTEANQRIQETDVDGVMIGRGIFANPWLFDPTKNIETITTHEKVQLLTKHVKLFDSTWGKDKNFEIMKKFFKMYIAGFEGASRVREELMKVKTPEEVYSFDWDKHVDNTKNVHTNI